MTARTVVVGAPDLVIEPALVTALSSSRDVGGVRRCVDAVDLLGVASTGAVDFAIVGAHLPRAGVELVEHLRQIGVAILGIVDVGDRAGEEALRRWGIDDVRSVDAESIPVVVGSVACRPEAAASSAAPVPDEGRVIAVWGPYGAPGRTTIAVGVADELARAGTATMLIDADPCGGAVGIHLGLLEESSGLVAACRRAEQGVLDLGGLARSARTVGKGLRVLTGLDAPTMWSHVRPTSLTRVLSLSRVAVDVTVVDAGFGLDRGGSSRGSSAVTLAAIDACDVVVAVASADPVGVSRLASSIGDLREVAGSRPVVVVVNRATASGRADQREIREALAALCDVHDVHLIPHETATSAALRDGVTLAEAAPRSQVRARLRELAEHICAIDAALVVPTTWSAA